jgi:hypothetical protein
LLRVSSAATVYWSAVAERTVEQLFTSVYTFLASTIHAAGPWAIPMVIAASGLIGMANRDRMMSAFGVFLIFATIALVTLVYAFQSGRI